jgi:polyphosphate kinase
MIRPNQPRADNLEAQCSGVRSAPEGGPDLRDPSLYFNRELSWLEFNRRVLAQACDPRMPLLERLRFLAISCTNLDEFFEVRVAGLKQQVAFRLSQSGPDGLTPQEQLQRVSQVAHELVREQYRVLNDELLPVLAAERIRILRRAEWDEAQQAWVRRFFVEEVLPVLTPIGLDPAHPFPRVLNKGLNFIVRLEGQDAFGRSGGAAVVPVPRALPRLFALPREVGGGPHDFVLLSAVVHAQIAELFPGMEVLSCHQFRVTRNSDLWVDEEEVDDLLHAIKGELPSRNYGAAVRLEVADDVDEETAALLLEKLQLGEDDLYRTNGPVNPNRLATLHELVERPELKFPPFVPGLPRRLASRRGPFEVLRRGDVLLHHPYESFAPVLELLTAAAEDPDVLAIKQTLYRTGAESPIVDALITAARNGKEVTAVVELRARFDEAANIQLATRLQEAGAKVAYGVVGHKTHAKLLLVVRREGRRLRNYVHLGTGNYHTGTTRQYTDLGLLTSDPELGEDVNLLFLELTSLGRVPRLRKLLQSPFTLLKALTAMIDREAELARRGRPARIRAKLNALTDPRVIQALYRASQAGVPIELVVRGPCTLRPGVPGISDTIRVRSIVGRFLEHSRVYHFHADGQDLVFGASADWMPRNLLGRVEVAFPIEDEALRKRVLAETLDAYLADDSRAWALGPDGAYRRLEPDPALPRDAQAELLERLAR